MNINERVAELIQMQLPAIKSIIFDKILPKITEQGEAFLKDESKLIMVLEKTYEMLPFPLRLILKKDDFIQFFIKHKELLLKNERAEVKEL